MDRKAFRLGSVQEDGEPKDCLVEQEALMLVPNATAQSESQLEDLVVSSHHDEELLCRRIIATESPLAGGCPGLIKVTLIQKAASPYTRLMSGTSHLH